MTAHPLSRRLWLALRAAISAALLGTVVAPAAWAQSPKSALNLAMVGEPQALDPIASTADLVGTIMQHVFETLYTFDAKWNVVPMLAEGMPTASRAALAAFNRETQPAKRAALWGAVQKVVCDEVPSINVGKFSSLSARSPALDAFQPATWAFF